MKKYLSLFLALLLIFSLAACGGTDTEEPEETEVEEVEEVEDSEGDLTAGIYMTEVQGHNGPMEVEVEFDDSGIVAIAVKENAETPHLLRAVMATMPDEIIENQSIEVDIIGGATITSMALIQGVKDAIEMADGNVEAFKNPIEKDAAEEMALETQVLIIGGGSGGLATAMRAQEAGLDVILIEKNGMVGGHTALSEGWFLVTDAQVQKDLGVEGDTAELAYEDLMENGGHESVEQDLQLYIDHMGESVDWLLENINLELPDSLYASGENREDRILIPVEKGAGLIDAMHEAIDAEKVDIMLNTKAIELIEEDGKVIGAMAEDRDGNTYTITADATVLATGSYGARSDLLPENVQSFLYYGASFSTGDGLIMGEDIGADTVNLGYVEPFYDGVEHAPGLGKLAIYSCYAAFDASGILVDRSGERIISEKAPGPEIVAQQSAQDDTTLFAFMDQASFDAFYNSVGKSGISQNDIDGWLEENNAEAPIFAHGDTVEEVADIVGIDAENLQATIERYNGFVENGVDEDFGRPEASMQQEIGEGPYYIVGLKPRYATTLGGLVINEKLQIMNTDGEVIEGLFGAGDVVGGVRGNDSVPGSDVGWAITSGYLAGQSLEEMLTQ